MLVEEMIRKIEAAAAEYLDRDGKIIQGHVGHVDEWEREHKIKLHWNNWFEVSFEMLMLVSLPSSRL